MKIFRSLICATAMLGVLTLMPGRGLAQTAANSGQIVGQLLDSTGAALAGAEVKVRNTETNQSRQTRTDGSGRYAVSLLPPGPYEVSVSGSGLETATRQTLVTVGGTSTLNVTMGVAAVAADVNVTAAKLSASGAEAKTVLTALQVQNVPASGRRIRSIFQLTPATQIEPECGGFTVSGQKGTMININLDGGDTTNTHWCGHVEITPTVGLEALQEIQVLRSTFSAEFGRSTGGIVNMSTRSGTNQHRGTGFYLLRNAALTKRDPLGREQIDVTQQFGASFGGPINHDKTFFFIAPEFQRSTKPVETLYSSLDAQNVRGTTAAQELLTVAPEGTHEGLTDSRSVVTRVDHRLGDRHNLMGRFDYVRNHITNSVGSFNLFQGIGVSSVTNRDMRGQLFINDRNTTTGMVQFTSVLSDRLLNELRVMAFSRVASVQRTAVGPRGHGAPCGRDDRDLRTSGHKSLLGECRLHVQRHAIPHRQQPVACNGRPHGEDGC